ncbi:peptidase C39-like protein [Streptomyces sp. 846.5]|nr:C39 family peptidase [Streptomyces sp. 846.5]TDT93330.1 peptidase C39-like protein [Streptomyces sp. 846.5]
MNTALRVPYYAQWESPQLVPQIVARTLPAAQDPAWAASGAHTPEEYEWWSWRVCGMACLRMALHHWRGIAPPTLELARECTEAGAYVVHDDRVDGLIYAPFTTYVRDRWNLDAAVVVDLTPEQIRDHLDAGRLVMISVHPTIRTLHPTPPRQGGHLVLAVDHDATHLMINNPSGFPESQHYARVPWGDLDRFYARRGVVLADPA